jgi:predicted enzyme related to lactoylglutathione lyase
VGTIISLTEGGVPGEARPCLAKVIVGVSDMQRAVEFYRDSIGLELETPRESARYADEAWVTFNAGLCTLALRRGPVHPPADTGPTLVLTVASIDDAVRRLKERAVDIELVSSPAPGLLLVNIRDPDGNSLSLESFAPVQSTRFIGDVSFTVI